MNPQTYYLCIQEIKYIKDGEIDSRWSNCEDYSCSQAGIDSTDGFDLIDTYSSMYWQNIIQVSDGLKFKDGRELFNQCAGKGVGVGCWNWNSKVSLYQYAFRPEGYFLIDILLKKRDSRIPTTYNINDIVEVKKPSLICSWLNYYSSLVDISYLEHLTRFEIKLLPRYPVVSCSEIPGNCSSYDFIPFNFQFDNSFSDECLSDLIEVLENDYGECKPCEKLSLLDYSLRRLL